MHATNKRHAIHAAELERLYLDEGWSMARLAAHFGVAQSTVKRRLAELGVAARRRGPVPKRGVAAPGTGLAWSPQLAYVIGIIATDGNLSSDGRHLAITSKDPSLLTTVRQCLRLGNAITLTFNSRGDQQGRLQWSDRTFFDALLSIGLTPAKSLTLGPLQIPDAYFADFLRGCVDGDGSILVYTDRYHTPQNPAYVYQRLAVKLVSASRDFVVWIRATTQRLFGISGALISQPQRQGKAAQWSLKYSKRESIVLLRMMYYAPGLPCLSRKREKALTFLHDLP
jgi:hypothetical protein